MSNEFQGFMRKTFSVQAARVTPLNIKELAAACGGRIMHDGAKEGNFSRDYIKVRVAFPINERQTQAHVGDWLVKQGGKFKVYQDKPFRNTFETPEGQPVPHVHIEKPAEAAPSPASMPKHIEQSEPSIATAETQEAPVEEAATEQAPAVEETISEAEAIEEVGGEAVEDIPEIPAEGNDAESSVTEGAEDVVEEKKSITLDELNTQPGDPRSAQEIMNEGHSG